MGQEWEINFTDVPNNAGDVTIVVLGEHLNLGDMEGAFSVRKQKKQSYHKLFQKERI